MNRPKFIAFPKKITDPTLLEEIMKQQLEVACSFYSKFSKGNSKNSTISEAAQSFQIDSILQIRGQFVVQIDPQSNRPVSDFRCDPVHSFIILKKNQKSIGLRFRLEEIGTVSFFIKNDQKKFLRNFSLVLQKKYIVYEGYDLIQKKQIISVGSLAPFYSAICLLSEKWVAIKCFSKTEDFKKKGEVFFCLLQAAFQKNFKALTQLKQKNIAWFQGVFETIHSLYLAIEYFPKSLDKFLLQNSALSSSKKQSLMIGLLEGVQYIHSKGLIFKDLKMENIIIDDQEGKQPIPKILFFELEDAEHIKQDQCGTSSCVSEKDKINSKDSVIKRTSQCDIISLGNIFYNILMGKTVHGLNCNEQKKQNIDCNIDFEKEDFKRLGEDATDLLKRMRQVNPEKRISAKQALKHKYFEQQKYPNLENEKLQTHKN